jgi:hypothetical protein
MSGYVVKNSGTGNAARINQNRAAVGLPPIAGGDKISDNQGYEELWSFSLSRLTGKAELKQENKAAIAYSCSKTKAVL